MFIVMIDVCKFAERVNCDIDYAKIFIKKNPKYKLEDDILICTSFIDILKFRLFLFKESTYEKLNHQDIDDLSKVIYSSRLDVIKSMEFFLELAMVDISDLKSLDIKYNNSKIWRIQHWKDSIGDIKDLNDFFPKEL